MPSVVITRESILRGDLHASVRALLGPDVPLMDDAQREAEIDAMLQQLVPGERLWVFGFGSLIWNPAFYFDQRCPGQVFGYHRAFCLWARSGRGSPQRPGLMLSLKRGGSCHGVLYQLPQGGERQELDVLWRREMLTMAYKPVLTRARCGHGWVRVLTFTANRSHERYVPDLGAEQEAMLLASGEGPLGRASDYLFDTHRHLLQLGITDQRLQRLCGRVDALMKAQS